MTNKGFRERLSIDFETDLSDFETAWTACNILSHCREADFSKLIAGVRIPCFLMVEFLKEAADAIKSFHDTSRCMYYVNYDKVMLDILREK